MIDEQDEREKKEFLESLTTLQRMVDNVWYFVPGTIVLWIVSFGFGLLIGIFL